MIERVADVLGEPRAARQDSLRQSWGGSPCTRQRLLSEIICLTPQKRLDNSFTSRRRFGWLLRICANCI
jgi:hypothetical protein